MTSYRALTLAPDPGQMLLSPQRSSASASDPAMSLLTDLSSGAVVVVQPDDRADQVLQMLMRAGVRMGFVGEVREGRGTIRGVVTAGDLAGEHVTRRALDLGVAHDELSVEQVMSPLSDWPLVELRSLPRAAVGDVIATLQASGQRYLIVIETVDGQPVLRGVFSASRIEQSLGTSLQISLRSQSFAELHSALQHS
ncbi:hypothetical protein [Rivibacter subsaxonicus]|uniref:hypothetical protein n=1 Tax=Rivibacter subsaxonicus TaxID=457575 RepID=UPI00102C6F2F|nr:hypothetical protein [Rivibacter subsaxonicus]